MKLKQISKFFPIVAAALWVFAGTAFAATPTLSVTSTGNGDSVQINVTGDPNASVILYYTATNTGSQIYALPGTTSASGTFSNTISSATLGIASGSSVYVKTNGVNGPQSASVTWPNVTTNGAFALNPTGAVLAVGQTISLTASNYGSVTPYLSNNSNPPIANVNISGGQISITALSNGSTTVTICIPANGTVSSSCASAFINVQSNGGQSLTFSLSNVTVTPGQNVPVTVSGGNGSFSVLNNSNSSVIQTNLSGSTVTLSTTVTSGSAAITVCSTDMAACGIINATAGSSSTLPLSFSPVNPTVTMGQSANVVISGGISSSYYVSTNSNTTAVGSSLNSNVLTVTGLNNGAANLTICSNNGSCGNLTVTVNYTSTGGTIALSQTSATLLVGQVLSVTVTGGISPYTLSSQNGSSVVQSSINGNIITLSGIASGSSTLNVCSSGGACASLVVTVNASGAGTPISFSQNNLNLTAGGVTALTISGSGGYYVSTSANPAVASVQISGNTALVTALAAGSNNISICQSGGQCAILFVAVTSGSGTAVSVPTFSQTNPSVAAGSVITETISGGTSSNYYILANTNPTSVQLSLNGSQLSITGLSAGSSTVAICSAANSCGVLTIAISGSTSSSVYFNTTSLSPATALQAYSTQLSASGGSGGYTYTVSGSLPVGLSLSTTGLLSGTPTIASSSNLSIVVKDSSGNSSTGNFALVVNAPSSISVPVTSPATTTPASGYPNGELINENGTVYIVYQKTKVGFANAAAFLGLGFNFGNVTSVSNSGLALSPKVVVTASGAHPRGAWLLNGKQVYFITPTGLIPVPSWTIFLNNGGQGSFIVPANSYDLAFTMLPIMTLNDPRMQ